MRDSIFNKPCGKRVCEVILHKNFFVFIVVQLIFVQDLGSGAILIFGAVVVRRSEGAPDAFSASSSAENCDTCSKNTPRTKMNILEDYSERKQCLFLKNYLLLSFSNIQNIL